MDGILEGKVALVTGAGAGLGRGIAEQLARAGADIAVAEIHPDAAESAAHELAALGVRAKAYPTDVSKSDQVDAAFAAARAHFGRLDIVVNNAGISHVGPHTQDVTDEEWLSSIRGHSPNPGRMTYCAPKAAVIMMTSVAAGEWAHLGIRVNAIAPGVLRTPMWDADVARGAIDEEFYLELVPAKRLGTPEDVGRLAVYLASDASSYVNGSCITIDGALTSIPAG